MLIPEDSSKSAITSSLNANESCVSSCTVTEPAEDASGSVSEADSELHAASSRALAVKTSTNGAGIRVMKSSLSLALPRSGSVGSAAATALSARRIARAPQCFSCEFEHSPRTMRRHQDC